MAFEPVKLVHPKTGIVVTATTAVDLTTFRFNDGYVPVDVARTLVNVEGTEKKYPKLVEGLKALDEAEKTAEVEAEGKEPEAPKTESDAPKTAAGKPAPKSMTAGKSGTDASGNQVGVN